MKLKITLLLLAVTVSSLAQNNQAYKQKSEELKKTIWQSNNDIFSGNNVPDEFKTESAVVLARSFEMQRESSSKWKFTGLAMANVGSTSKNSLYREKIKINDKASLETFSKLEYEKVINKTQSLLFSSIKNKTEVFVGVKIIKPDGKETIISTDEEVLLSTNSKNQTAKLAIPGLQVGDIIDYYIYTVKIVEDGGEKENKYLFFLADEYPVLHYIYTFQYNKKVDVVTLNANGAPKFTETTNTNGDKIFTLKGDKMLKFKDELWSSSFRALPYFAISSNYKTAVQKAYAMPNEKFDAKKSNLDNYVTNFGNMLNSYLFPYSNAVQKKTESIFKSKGLKTLPLDSTIKFFYNFWKYDTFFDYTDDRYNMGIERNYATVYNQYSAAFNSQMLYDMEIPHDLIVTSSKYSNSLDDVFEQNDFDVLIRINGPKPMYMAFDYFNTHFNELPVRYEGQRAIVLTPKKINSKKYTFTKTETTLPQANAEDNKLQETISVQLTPTNLQTINVKRNVKETGFMRISDQLSLLLMEDADKEFTQVFSGDEMKKRVKGYNQKKTYENLLMSIADAKKAEKQNFINEIKNQYDQEPKELSSYKIVNTALSNNKPFEFSTTFTMDGFVKKAGTNYIFTIGKLIGAITKLEEKNRTRQTDIVMPTARTINYSIEFEIPEGYSVKGLENLNTSKQNEMGLFIVKTSSQNNKIKIDVNRIYAIATAPKEKWDSVVELIDAAYDFSEQKVLLEKIN